MCEKVLTIPDILAMHQFHHVVQKYVTLPKTGTGESKDIASDAHYFLTCQIKYCFNQTGLCDV